MKANNLLSGNDPSEGWGSQYLGNPKSLSRFLPEKFIKKLPPQAESSLRRGNSVNSTTSSDSSGSSLQGESSNWKRSQCSNQGKHCDKRVKFNETSTSTSATSAPVPSHRKTYPDRNCRIVSGLKSPLEVKNQKYLNL